MSDITDLFAPQYFSSRTECINNELKKIIALLEVQTINIWIHAFWIIIPTLYVHPTHLLSPQYSFLAQCSLLPVYALNYHFRFGEHLAVIYLHRIPNWLIKIFYYIALHAYYAPCKKLSAVIRVRWVLNSRPFLTRILQIVCNMVINLIYSTAYATFCTYVSPWLSVD